MAQNWYYSRAGERTGPLSLEQIQGLVRTGDLHLDDLVWTEGMETWTEASSVRALGMAAPAEPPPIPAGAGATTASEVDRLLRDARQFLARGDLHEAITRADAAVRLDPRIVNSYLVRAEALRRLKKTERAMADLAVVIRLAPDRPETYLVRAAILRKQLRFDQAIADATQALMLNPSLSTAYAIRAECRRLIGDDEGARHDTDELIRLDPTLPISMTSTDPAQQPPPLRIEEELLDSTPVKPPISGDNLFADGKSADWSFRSRVVHDDEAPEVLGTSSGYKPGVIVKARRSGSGNTSRSQTSSLLPVLLLFVGLIGAGALLYRSRTGSDAKSNNPGVLAGRVIPASGTVEHPGSVANPAHVDAGHAAQPETTASLAAPKNIGDAGRIATSSPLKAPNQDLSVKTNPDGSLGSHQTAEESVKLRVAISKEGDCRILLGRSIPELSREESDGLTPITTSYASSWVGASSGASLARNSSRLEPSTGQPAKPSAMVLYPRAFRLPCVLTVEITEFRDGLLGVQFLTPCSNIVLSITSDDGLKEQANIAIMAFSNDRPGSDLGFSKAQRKLKTEKSIQLNRTEVFAFKLPLSPERLGDLYTFDAVLRPKPGNSPLKTVVAIENAALLASDKGTLGMDLGLKQGKLLVEKVDPQGLAAQSGIQAGDLIVAFEGNNLPALTNTGSLTFAFEFGSKPQVALSISRGGKEQAVTIKFD